MLIEHGDGSATAGRFDVLFIYRHYKGTDSDGRPEASDADTYHVVFYEESPLPGSYSDPNPEVVRLKSKYHHPTGAETLDDAQAEMRRLREKLVIDDCNVDDQNPVPWDGEIGDVIVVPNWRLPGRERQFCTTGKPVSAGSNPS